MNYTKAKASAPGKIILIGEHAVVYGYSALIAAVNLRAECEIEKYKNGKVKIFLTRFGLEQEYSWEEVINKNKEVEGLLQVYEKTKDNNILKELKETSNLAKFALYETLNYLNISNPPGIILKGDSEIPIGGFGSSSAAIAVIVKSFIKFLGNKLTKDSIVEIVSRSEHKLQGYRSTGADQNAVVRGGLIKFTPGKDKEIENIKAKNGIIKDCLIIESGKPESSTGEVVAYIKKLKDKNPKLVDDIFEEISRLTNIIENALLENDKESLFKAINNAGDQLIKLGIVSQKTQELIQNVRNLGAFVKVSGAGTLSGEGSGALLCFAYDYEKIVNYLEKQKVKYIRLRLGVRV